MGIIDIKGKRWEFIEILGYTDNVGNAIKALKRAKLLHGYLSSNEEKGNKRFVQFYNCSKSEIIFTQHEKSMFKAIAISCQVNIEYTFMGADSFYFPNDNENDFSIKYREWWITD